MAEPGAMGSVARFLREGVAVIVGTRDDDLVPDVVRAWGPELQAGDTLELCVVAPAGSRARRNLEGNGAIAATFSLPTSYRTVQLKGRATRVAEPGEAELARVRRHLDLFVEQVTGLGLPPAASRRLFSPELRAVTVRVEAVFDQTPGPGAGGPL